MNLNIDPSWINSSLLFVIGVLLIVAVVLVLLLIEAKRAKARIEATLEGSVARHKVLLQEHRAEIEVIEHKHLEKLAEIAKAHHYEMETLRGILAISDLDRDEALNAASKAQEHGELMQNRIDQITALISSWATGNDETAASVRHALRAEGSMFQEQIRQRHPHTDYAHA